MQFQAVRVLLAFVALTTAAGSYRANRRASHRQNRLGGGFRAVSREAVEPEDLARCVKTVSDFIVSPVRKDDALRRAGKHCQIDMQLEHSSSICPHFREGIATAFRGEAEDKEYSAEDFCQVTEAFMLEIRTATRVPHVGSGPMMDFKVSEECAPTVESAFDKEKDGLAPADVPDFWYSLCSNQDCAHLLPSTTRWCDVQHKPMHSIAVCDAVRRYAYDEVNVLHMLPYDDPFDGKQLCKLYGEFVKEMGLNVEAYDHIIHGGQDTHLIALEPRHEENPKKGNAVRSVAYGGVFAFFNLAFLFGV